MEERDLQLIAALKSSHSELAALFSQHRELEGKLHSLDGRTWLSDTERLEVKRLKRMKLHRKDRIEAILARHR